MSTATQQNYQNFAEDNMLGPPYISFETNQQQRNFLASMASAAREPQQQLNSRSNIGTRSVDLSLAKNVQSKLRGSKSKDDVPIDLTFKPIAIPSDVPVHSFTVDPSKVDCFYGRDHFLSNYFTATMTVNSVAYRTVEHYYEACKLFSFGGYQFSSQLNLVKDAGAAKVTSKRILQFIDKRKLEAWKRSEGLEVIENALTHKFSQHSDLAAKLLATGDSFLAHCNPYDTLWGTGLSADKLRQWATLNQGVTMQIPRNINAKTLQYCPTSHLGQNALGYLLMQIRGSLQAKLNKLDEEGEEEDVEESESAVLTDDDEAVDNAAAPTLASKTPIGTPSGGPAIGANSNGAKASPPPPPSSSGGEAAKATGTNLGTANNKDVPENVRKLCEQLANMNAQQQQKNGGSSNGSLA